MKLKSFLQKRIVDALNAIEERDVYALSLFTAMSEVEIPGEKDILALPEVKVGYNTESECDGAEPDAEERWNSAFWQPNEMTVLSSTDEEDTETMIGWYRSLGISPVGYEDEATMYDEDMRYIGKGPSGLAEILAVLSEIVAELHRSGYIREKFGEIPVILCDPEYSPYMIQATMEANPAFTTENFKEYVSSIF